MTLATAHPIAFPAREVRNYLKGPALSLATERQQRGERYGYHAAKRVIADVATIVHPAGTVNADDLIAALKPRLEAAEAEVATLRNLMVMFELNKSCVERGLPTTFAAGEEA